MWEEGSIPPGQRRRPAHSPAQQRQLLLCCREQNKQLGGVANMVLAPEKLPRGQHPDLPPRTAPFLLSVQGLQGAACGSGIGVLPSVCQPGPIRANPGVFTSATRQEMPSLAGCSSEIQSQEVGRGSQAERQRNSDRGKHLALKPLYEQLDQAKPEAKILPFTLGCSVAKSNKWRLFGFGLLVNYKQRSPH